MCAKNPFWGVSKIRLKNMGVSLYTHSIIKNPYKTYKGNRCLLYMNSIILPCKTFFPNFKLPKLGSSLF